jgi:cobalt-zinc-cadmium efflux system protein
MLVELAGGFLTNSLALISDAGHMLSDAFALGLSLSALLYGERAATPEKTYGYKRFEILAALLNGILLVVLSAFILTEAVSRFSQPEAVMGEGMMLISVIGLIVNVVVAFVLSRGQTGENLNVKSAFLHVIGDLLGSIGAIAAAILIIFFDWSIADPIASIIVSLLVLYSGWHILKDAVNILMEGKPANIDSEKVTAALKTVSGVTGVHDLHIWMITSDFPTLSVHLNVEAASDRDAILEEAVHIIYGETGIRHITVQTEGRELSIHEECRM